MPLVKSNISVIHCIIFVPFCFPCRPLCRSLTACSMRRVNAPPTAKPPSATSYRRGAYRAFSSTLNKLESGIHSAKCTSFQGSTVPPRQELGLLQKAAVDANQETGRVCYPMHQFRCLLAETGTGKHILGKGLLVISEDWLGHRCNATFYISPFTKSSSSTIPSHP